MGERSIPAGRRTQLISLLVLEQSAQEVTLDRELGLLAWRSLEPQSRRGRGEWPLRHPWQSGVGGKQASPVASDLETCTRVLGKCAAGHVQSAEQSVPFLTFKVQEIPKGVLLKQL